MVWLKESWPVIGYSLLGDFYHLSALVGPPSLSLTMRKIFGIGWAKTGTTTLGCALSTLGFNHQGQNISLLPQALSGDLSKVIRVASAADSFDDWPWILIYKEMDLQFPGSKFILTVRDPSEWLHSYRAMLLREPPPSEYLVSIRNLIYGFNVHNASDADLIQRYKRHCADVSTYFSSSPEKLLVVNWGLGDGWSELCEFLHLPIPISPFPWLNKR